MYKQHSFDDISSRDVVKQWISDPRLITQIYGHISAWDVSNVNDMSKLFMYCDFDEDLSLWNVSNVHTMDQMFYGCFCFTNNNLAI